MTVQMDHNMSFRNACVCMYVYVCMCVCVSRSAMTVVDASAGLLYWGHLVGCLLWFMASDDYSHPFPDSWAAVAGLSNKKPVEQYVTPGWLRMLL